MFPGLGKLFKNRLGKLKNTFLLSEMGLLSTRVLTGTLGKVGRTE